MEGLRVELIRVEADVSNGLPVFHMVGYLSSEVKEASERVRTAIRNSGYSFPAKRTVINLAPATMRKRGASFDLPIAAAILVSLGEIDAVRVKDTLLIGELSLDGQVRKVPGILPVVMEAKKGGDRLLYRSGGKCQGGCPGGRDEDCRRSESPGHSGFF